MLRGARPTSRFGPNRRDRGYDAGVSGDHLRVSELAKRLGVPSRRILELSAEIAAGGPTTAQSNVAPDLVDEITARVQRTIDPARHEEGLELIRAAFEQARSRGKAEWQQMSIAVLKNRILALTHNTFAESAWGVARFRDFLALYPEAVVVDVEMHPARVTLRDAPSPNAPVPPKLPDSWTGPQLRIRNDLWLATVDLTGTKTYIWRDGVAVPFPVGEAAGVDSPCLPTATPAEMSQWRSDFSHRMLESPRWAGARTNLERWVEHGSSQGLPHALRAEWMAELKRQVQVRLESWFGRSVSPYRSILCSRVSLNQLIVTLIASVASSFERSSRCRGRSSKRSACQREPGCA